MQDGNSTALRHVSPKSVVLLFRRRPIGPNPIFNVDTPVDDVGVFNVGGESLSGPRT